MILREGAALGGTIFATVLLIWSPQEALFPEKKSTVEKIEFKMFLEEGECNKAEELHRKQHNVDASLCEEMTLEKATMTADWIKDLQKRGITLGWTRAPE